jgi:hypothetical protein
MRVVSRISLAALLTVAAFSQTKLSPHLKLLMFIRARKAETRTFAGPSPVAAAMNCGKRLWWT